jgi:hypothetical protein
MAARKAKAKKSKKTPIKKSKKTTKKKAAKKLAKPKPKKKLKRKTAKSGAAALSRKHPEHGVFPDSPPIFAVDEADAETAIGITRGRR